MTENQKGGGEGERGLDGMGWVTKVQEREKA